MPSTRVGAALTVDVSDFQKFARALTKAAPLIHTNLLLRLRAVGEIVAGVARDRVGRVSYSVPPSIKVRISGASVAVQAGGPGVPLAGLLELGNVGQRGGDTFRHPVFGNRANWVEEAMYPYLLPSVQAKVDEVERAALEALEVAMVEAVVIL